MLGIFLSFRVILFADVYIYLAISFVVLYCLLILWQKQTAIYRYRFLTGITGFVMLLTLSIVYAQLRQPVTFSTNSDAQVKLHIIESIGSTEQNLKFEAYFSGSSSDSISYLERQRGIVYMPKSIIKHQPDVDMYMFATGRFIPFSEPNSQFDFNYSNYLRNQRIAFRLIVSEYQLIEDKSGLLHPVILSARLKAFLRDKYQEAGLNETQLAILNALFLGDKSLLSYEQKSAFSDAGAMHLLAVSGLHVGIIYMLLMSIVSVFRARKYKLLTALVVILCLWFYAAVTGFSPSVLRASLMFTILEFGRISKRQTGIFNLLGASMFIIVIIEPLSIFNIGFWLSHIAVASIVSFYPKINNWFHFRFPPFKWGWSIIAVSIAAQLGTLPIAIYAFHEFPLYFIVTNIVLIPVVTPILVMAVIAALCSFSMYILRLIVPGMGSLLTFMNDTAHWIDQLPYSTIQHLYVEGWQLPLLYGSLILLLVYINYRYLMYLKYLLVLGIITIVTIHVRSYYLPEEVLYVAKINGKSVVNHLDKQSNTIYTNVPLSEKEIEFAFNGLWAYCNAPVSYTVRQVEDKPNASPIVSLIGGKALVILPEGAKWSCKLEHRKVDYLVLMGKPEIDFKEVRSTMRVGQVVIPNGWKWYQKKWFDGYDEHIENLHDVSEDGVFLVAFRND
ncbi:ComEC/Rec2 family competence protein [Carboxylicivirga mesophila]|nr:ComEC/Rec2 family competence protein [Carboxylicivirga mesophila]